MALKVQEISPLLWRIQRRSLSEKGAVTLDRLAFNKAVKKDSVMPLSKAFRYVNIASR